MTLCPLSELGAVTSGRERKRHHAEESGCTLLRALKKGTLTARNFQRVRSSASAHAQVFV